MTAEDIDLAVRWLGGSVVAASDEAFGDKESLIRPEQAPTVEPGHYGNRGEIVDGWETRRRRTEGNDWAIIRLGAGGVIHEIDVDTTGFSGNYPVACRLEATARQGYPGVDELVAPRSDWREIVPRTPLRGDAHNVIPVADRRRSGYVRLSIFPDGGVARLRVHGAVIPDPRTFDGVTVDLAAAEHGGRVLSSSDDFYTGATALIRPGRPNTMGEGWETRRRRDEGHDWVVIALAAAGEVRRVVVDTTHFKYNASESAAIEATADDPSRSEPTWRPLLPRTRLQPDTPHHLDVPSDAGAVRAVRLHAYPDGGIGRLRVIGVVSPTGRREVAIRWFDALTEAEATDVLRAAGATDPAAIVASRPIADGWPRRTVGAAEADRRALESLVEGPAARSSIGLAHTCP
jgi:allantoicase